MLPSPLLYVSDADAIVSVCNANGFSIYHMYFDHARHWVAARNTTVSIRQSIKRAETIVTSLRYQRLLKEEQV